MKRIVMMAVVALTAGFLLAAEKAKGKTLTLDEAREKITEIIANPEKVGDVVKQLSAEDQNTFLYEVNKAIASMPGSNEAKTAKFLVVNREALLAAKKGNLQSMVATMFASTKLEGLTVMADRYADDLFNRASDATKTFTDEQFTEIASSTVKEVAKKCEGLPDAAPRDTLAVYLFEKSSNWSIPDLEDALLEIAISDPQLRQTAKSEWLTAAKSEGSGSERFSALLGYADAGRAANVDVVLRISGPQTLTAMLSDLAEGVVDSNGQQIMPITQGENPTERGLATSGQAQATTAAAQDSKPISADPTKPYNPQYSRSEAEEVKEEEPKPYPYQD